MNKERFAQVIAMITKVLIAIIFALAIYYASKVRSMPTIELNIAVGSIALALAAGGGAILQSMLNEKALRQIMTKLREIEEKMKVNRLDDNSEQDLMAISAVLTGIVRLIEHFKKNKKP